MMITRPGIEPQFTPDRWFSSNQPPAHEAGAATRHHLARAEISSVDQHGGLS
jgi:hypothetical protein